MPALKKRSSAGPMGGAGLLRYFDVDEGGPKVSPKVIIGIAGGLIVLELLFKIILE
ncbi:preprotein translocase subunit Sec61beta [Candidatus Altiarchaeota archaeon]